MTFDELRDNCSRFGLALDDSKIQKLEAYLDLVLETNKVMNLTAIDDKAEGIEKHLFDSLLIFKLTNFENSKIIDIGTGAGFPGIVIAICQPTSHVTLLDATTKKINFLKDVAAKLDLENVDFINSRVEDLRKQRESFDYATARAFSSLATLVEVGVPLVKVKGKVIALKSSKAEEEIEIAKNALHKLESKIVKIGRDILPESNDPRVNIVIEKEQKSSKRYPRDWAEISAKPL